jgi:hypothetical protein
VGLPILAYAYGHISGRGAARRSSQLGAQELGSGEGEGVKLLTKPGHGLSAPPPARGGREGGPAEGGGGRHGMGAAAEHFSVLEDAGVELLDREAGEGEGQGEG